jgi:serine acetyltransferase
VPIFDTMMSILFKKIFKIVIYALFEEHEFKRLEKDLERRFRKPFRDDRSLLKKIRYLNENFQYKTLIYYRLDKACKFSLFKKFFSRLYRKYSEKTGIEFFPSTLGGGVIFPHWGRIILNAEIIGDNLYVFHNVTIGNDYISGKPRIGNNVFIGTSSVILGDISIGDNVVIGACSFVNTDIPSNSLAVGNPAKVIKQIDNEYISRLLGY